ncbi:aspartyl protease family protein [Sphingobium sp. AN558]|uniref:aspartyl protease family protein n=1 Tax=Sphingobium sp. AN558 TaxID=3133442 RepID=UPI0030BC1AEA
MRRFRAGLALAAVLFCPIARAQNALPLDPATPPVIVPAGPPADARVTIAVAIGGKGPWNFIVDTGAQRTVIARDLAQQLALPPGVPVTVISMTGRTDTPTVALPRLSFGTDGIDDIEAPVLEGRDIGAAGLLGLDGLHAKRLLLDFRTGRMEISDSGPRMAVDRDTIVVQARRRKGQLILLGSQVNGMKVDIMLDTGTNISVGNLALMRKLQTKGLLPGLEPASLTSVTGGSLAGPAGIIAAIRLGPVTLKGVPVMFADVSPFAHLGLRGRPALLLGIDALRLFDRVAIDFGRGKVDFLLPDTGALDPLRFAQALPVRG